MLILQFPSQSTWGQPDTARNPDSIESRHEPHRTWTDIVELPGARELYATTLDGHRIRLLVFNSATEKRPLLLLLPDIFHPAPEPLLPLIRQLGQEFHVVLLIPRGDPPVDRNVFGDYRPSRQLTTDLHRAEKYYQDYRTALTTLREYRAELHLQTSGTCALAGNFHSNLLLHGRVDGLDCVVLLSPNQPFYNTLLPATEDESEQNNIESAETGNPTPAPLREVMRFRNAAAPVSRDLPVLLITGYYYSYEVGKLHAALPRSEMIVRAQAGVGFSMLHRKPDLIPEIIRFVRAHTGPE